MVMGTIIFELFLRLVLGLQCVGLTIRKNEEKKKSRRGVGFEGQSVLNLAERVHTRQNRKKQQKRQIKKRRLGFEFKVGELVPSPLFFTK